ncbi:pectinesterase-like [Macadamia integrifolia]|uniref:pectinesterase-like n=1 Tax=Macadamia integrifolia TaxID=60698 RepID=UPI001C530907|nr:pectinesterase-like [Macadamia integrifolia]
MMGKGKAIVAGVSLILVVGVVVGVVAGISRSGKSTNDASGNIDNNLSTGMKAVKTICEPTDYKDVCMRTLGTVANNGTANPKDFIKVAVSSTMDVVKTAMEKATTLSKNIDNSTQKNALADCNELLQYAVDDLQESISMVGDNELKTVNERVADLTNWLSAVVAYQQTCLDGISHPELKSAMENGGIINATELTSNALAIVTEIANILSAFNIPIDINPKSRRLLEEETTALDGEGFPTWFSAADRKLLAARGGAQMRPNAVVAKDGSGQYKTITAALNAYPKNNKGRYVIYVKAGIYDEYITVTKDQANVFMYGDGPRKSIVTGNKSNKGGFGTFKTASFSAIGKGFIARGMGFRNTAGPEGHQAVALRVQSDFAAFYNCRMDGYQDTLYVQTYRQFYRNCVVSGTVDFIFGDSTTVMQNCLIIARKPMDNQQNTVTAHGRAIKRETTGLVIQNSRIVPEQKLFPVRFKIPTFLGRPWKEYARTVIMESTLGDFIQPAGWMPWDTTGFAQSTCYYAEYANRGPGARTNRRVRWKGVHVITDRREAAQFTAGPFLSGHLWLRATGAPFLLGFKR